MILVQVRSCSVIRRTSRGQIVIGELTLAREKLRSVCDIRGIYGDSSCFVILFTKCHSFLWCNLGLLARADNCTAKCRRERAGIWGPRSQMVSFYQLSHLTLTTVHYYYVIVQVAVCKYVLCSTYVSLLLFVHQEISSFAKINAFLFISIKTNIYKMHKTVLGK